MREKAPHSVLSPLLSVNPETGEIFWRQTRGRVKAGARAGGDLRNGYLGVRVFGMRYLAHQIVWLFAFGKWPKGEIDHINGNRQDNRISNLRDVSRIVNQQNQKTAHTDSTVKLLGVSRSDSAKGFRARIQIAGKENTLGVFETAQEAHEAYLIAKRKYHVGNTL